MSDNQVYHIEDIMKFLPHRYPFLLIDRLVVEEPGIKAYGIKNVTMNEEFFQGHFPGNPIMPGVLQIEAMAQSAGAMVVAADEKMHGKAGVLFMSVDGVKFRKPVKPGDQLQMHVELTKSRGRICTFKGKCRVDDKVVSECEFTAMILSE